MKTIFLILFIFFPITAYAAGPIEWSQKSAEIKQQERQAEAQERIAKALESIAASLERSGA